MDPKPSSGLSHVTRSSETYFCYLRYKVDGRFALFSVVIAFICIHSVVLVLISLLYNYITGMRKKIKIHDFEGSKPAQSSKPPTTTETSSCTVEPETSAAVDPTSEPKTSSRAETTSEVKDPPKITSSLGSHSWIEKRGGKACFVRSKKNRKVKGSRAYVATDTTLVKEVEGLLDG